MRTSLGQVNIDRDAIADGVDRATATARLQQVVARALADPTTVTLEIQGAARLTAGQARALRQAAVVGRKVVLVVDAVDLGRLAVDRLCVHAGAGMLVVRAPIALHGDPALRGRLAAARVPWQLRDAAPQPAPKQPRRTRWPDAAEWIAIDLGIRRVWRADLHADDAADLEAAAQSAGLHALRGALVNMDDGGMWHHGSERDGRVLLYVGPDPADLARADAIERDTLAWRAAGRFGQAGARVDPAANNDRAMAALLGYPVCCGEAFVQGHQTWTADDAQTTAEVAYYALRAARATAAANGTPDRRLGFFSPLSGACVLRHYPCRLDCAESLAQAAAIDAAAWARDPARQQRDEAARADALLLFASGATLPLRGEPQSDGSLHHPTPMTAGRLSWAPYWQPMLQRLVPLLDNARALRPRFSHAGSGGVDVIDAAGGSAGLALEGGFPAGGPQRDFPRLLVFPAGRSWASAATPARRG